MFWVCSYPRNSCSHCPGGYQVNSEGEDQGWAGHGSYPQRDWDHVISAPPSHHFYIRRWRSAACFTAHTHSWQNHISLFSLNVDQCKCPKSNPPCAHSALVARLQDVVLWHADVIIGPELHFWDVIHLLYSVWLPGPVKVWMALTVCIWISLDACVQTCVWKVCV